MPFRSPFHASAELASDDLLEPRADTPEGLADLPDVSDRVRDALDHLERQTSTLDDVASDLEGIAEETDARSESHELNRPAIPAVDPVPIERAVFLRVVDRVRGVVDGLSELRAASTTSEVDLSEIPADVKAYHDSIEKAWDGGEDVIPDTRAGVAALVTWALDAGADPWDLYPFAPPTVCEIVRRVALMRPAPAPRGAAPRAQSSPPSAHPESLPMPNPAPPAPISCTAVTGCGLRGFIPDTSGDGRNADLYCSCPAGVALEAQDERDAQTPAITSRPTSTVIPMTSDDVDMRPPSLGRFSQQLRDYQQATVDDALRFEADMRTVGATAVRRRLYAMPTGTGKGSTELVLLDVLRGSSRKRDAWILTPSLDVIRGYLERCGASSSMLADAGDDRLATLGESIFVTTPARMQNRILAGDRGAPDVVIYDEVHHATLGNDVSGTLFALAPLAVWLGFTATPFRGSPLATRELEEAWPDMVDVLTIPEAVANGSWMLPTFEVVGLVDDDEIAVKSGDFAVKAAGALVSSRIEAVALLVVERLNRDAGPDARPEPQNGEQGAGRIVPTCVVTPNTETASLMVEALDRAGVSARRVGQDTKAKDRALAYAECRSGRGVLVSVRVLAEGVDFPWLRRLIDARPTLSPVSWLQQIGRITRPGPIRPEYICVCRNLERHAYLLQGMIPRRIVGEAQAAFPIPSKRGGGRAMGLEQLTRFKPIELPLAEGVRGVMFALYAASGEGVVTEWVTLLDPTSERAVHARRTVRTIVPGTGPGTGEKEWGKWEAVPRLPDDLAGHATSAFRGDITAKQAAWWERSALRHGLDPTAAKGMKQRQFACLPVLRDLGITMAAVPVVGGDA